LRREDVGDLNHIFKAEDLGNGAGFVDPDQEQGPSNPHHGGRGSYLKVLLFEFQQVLGKYPDLSDIHLERCGPLLFLGIKFKLIQVEVGLFRHAEDAAVFQFDTKHGIGAGLDVVAEMNGHSPGDLDGA
jgi:hypothetical protein